jgi:thiamine-monophosphate kinase
LNEFEIIEKYFKQNHPESKGNLILGIGDDAAIINVSEDSELSISTDTLVSGVHFFEDTDPEDIAYKALSVNLSDIAAMGALPRWVSLSLTLPEKDINWLERFASSFNQLATEHSVALIGGDLTKGPLSISIQIHGVAPKGKSLRRSGATVGDLIYVTGELGAAAYALNHIKEPDKFSFISDKEIQRLHRPKARVKTGLELRDNATSCIDVSDGLLADLGHILKASNVGAEIKLSAIPFSESLKKLEQKKTIELALTGGDDYELCFTLPQGLSDSVIKELQSICPVHCIGKINKDAQQLTLINEDGESYEIDSSAYRHFD